MFGGFVCSSTWIRGGSLLLPAGWWLSARKFLSCIFYIYISIFSVNLEGKKEKNSGNMDDDNEFFGDDGWVHRWPQAACFRRFVFTSYNLN